MKETGRTRMSNNAKSNFSINTITIKNIYDKHFLALKKSVKLSSAIDLMLKEDLNEAIIVNDDFQVIGILTHSDISASMKSSSNYENTLLEKYTKSSVRTVSEKARLSDCRDTMYNLKIGQLPVTKNGKLVGVIRSSHIRDHYYMGVEEFNHKLKNIIEAIHEGVCVIDKNGIVVYWNKSAEKLYNVKATDIIGKEIKDFFPEAILSRVLNENEAVENILHTPREDTHIAISASPVYYKNELFAVVSTDRDITDVINLSKDLEKANTTLRFLEEEVDRIANDTFAGLTGQDSVFLKNVNIGRQVAKSNVNVYIAGESGTGKDVFARAIHKKSDRTGLFVPVNCSAIPSELFESEFFGYEKGAFTGASESGKIGFFELANNGTLFLDEVADLPLNLQAKLLRILENGQFNKIGSSKTQKVDVRVISATNKNLNHLMQTGKFREDLYYRLNVVDIFLPPLRERGSDVELFLDKFLTELSEENNRKKPKIAPETLEILKKYSWKGNIRELKNSIEQMIVLSNSDVLLPIDIPGHIHRWIEDVKTEQINDFDLTTSVENLEKNMIISALEKCNYNKAKAAKLLNIKRSTLYYKINYYNL